MLLALDVGNTHTVLGLFEGPTLRARMRVRTVKDRTADEVRIQVAGLLADHGGLGSVDAAIVSSVVPALDRPLEEALEGRGFLAVHAGIDLGFEVAVDRPGEVGADRLVNAAGALRHHAPPLVIVDTGTALTVCAVGPGPRYLGGAIAPGLETAAESLYRRASKLAAVPLRPPPGPIGSNTEAALQSGLVLGHAALIDGLVARFVAALGGEATVLGTGGGLRHLGEALESVAVRAEDLTLDGLHALAVRNGLVGKGGG